jgi:hypothetical protein
MISPTKQRIAFSLFTVKQRFVPPMIPNISKTLLFLGVPVKGIKVRPSRWVFPDNKTNHK